VLCGGYIGDKKAELGAIDERVRRWLSFEAQLQARRARARGR
jgi:hypothetical protein